MARLEISGVSRVFRDRPVLSDVSLAVAEGGFLTLLGPSGCGKTTLLRLIAGLDRPTRGTIRIDGRVVADDATFVDAEERGLGMVFQSYALWPHMTVRRNVGFGLEVRRIPGPERARRIAAALEAVGLADYAGRRPHELSGGQRQRVALARCLALRPQLILLDEPLANLDAHLREAMQQEFRRLHRETGATIVHVTHDQAEAMMLADTIAVMAEGVVQQVAAPETLYARPANAMVARFIGRGALVPVTVLARDGAGRVAVDLAGHVVTVAGEASGGPGLLCLRPEDLAFAEGGAGAGVPVRVRDTVYRGSDYLSEVVIAGLERLTLQVASALPPAAESRTLAIRRGWVLPGPVALPAE